MQIRLTVLAPRSGHAGTRACDVLVTAPAGTALAAVASGLATAAAGPDASGGVVLYSGRERLDAQRCALGEPPLIDGAVLSLQVAGEDDVPVDDVPAQLHVVAGPDAGGVHLLHGGRVRIGRSADADVPLDDPDVSRLHCAVTVGDDGRVSVADLGSTNGTTLEGARVGERPVRLAPGALLRLGESALRLTTGGRRPALPTTPDGEGHLRVTRPGPDGSAGPDGAGQAAYGTTAGATGPGDPVAPGTSPAPGDEAGPFGPAGPKGATGRTDAPRRSGSPSPGHGPDHGHGPRRDHGQDGYGYGQDSADMAQASRTAHGGAGPRAAGPPYGGSGTDTPTVSVRHSGAGGSGPARNQGRIQSQGQGEGRTLQAYGPRPSSPIPGRSPGAQYGGPRYGSPPGAPRVPDPRGSDPHTHVGRADGADGTRWQVDGAPGADGPRAHSRTADAPAPGLPGPRASDPHASRTSGSHVPGQPTAGDGAPDSRTPDSGTSDARTPSGSRTDVRTPDARTPGSRRQGTPARGTEVPAAVAAEASGRRRSGGIGAWARRLAGGRDGETTRSVPGPRGADGATGTAHRADTWPDPAEVLLTALGPGTRLWERDSDHPEALVARLGTADRPVGGGPEGKGPLPAVPVTVGFREAGSLGLAGPRERLTGLARWTVAQLAALHSPADLEIVLIGADRTRGVEARCQDWGWLGWLPHVRPAHGQDCRLLLAYDRDQAAARTGELTRRLDTGPLGPSWASAGPEEIAEAAARHDGPRTLVIVDGDPGTAALREATARLAAAGSAAGIHLLCLAETPAASPSSPVAATYEEACAASLPFRECGAVALLSGDVATALRLLRTAVGRPAGHGTVAVVDAVSLAWADRFGRALAPLRASVGGVRGRPAAALPRTARLLDELGLARATPASLMARWASAADGAGDCTAVLGAGPHGPVGVDLTEEGPHLLIEGPTGSGRTELLRSVAASLAAAARPDRLALLLVDGAGGERGEGLAAATELPHVTDHLVASDPVRMRAFAQALGAELKRRAELLGRLDFAEWHARREAAERMSGRRPPSVTSAEGQRPPRRTEPYTPEPRTTEQRAAEQRAAEQRAAEQRAAEQRAAEQRAAEQRAAEQRAAASRTAESFTPESRTADPRTADPRTFDPRPAESRTAGPRTAESRAADPYIAESRTNAAAAMDRPRAGHAPDPRSGFAPRSDLDSQTRGTLRLRTTPARADRTGSGVPQPGAPQPGASREGAGQARTDRTGRADQGRGRSEQRPEPYPRSGAEYRPEARAEGSGRPAPSVEPAAEPAAEAAALPRLVVLVDDFDALVAPALGSPGRPAAGSVVRALEAVARDGERLGVHLVATSARPDRTVDTELAQSARLRIVLDIPPVAPAPDEPAPGRGRLGHPDGRVTPFQGGRVTGRIPRTATLRPTVVVLEWERMGDPPARRPVRELGNGPTDLALLASALERAARSVEAVPVAPLTSVHL
ncbi:FtsK/SpoIIIE domain-containing protein [Streptomyces sp. NRRL F-5135]|uniref:FtsK/SpoIIIE domain-containing protein n=1 Tax=Streptomyces sp. NRRL F-5135 TaxID=1463858 RepID=UPI00068F5768|nr:FtsK/SpoIIIE domain-containing protein [Streptomyces sp. NRRL F-5135]